MPENSCKLVVIEAGALELAIVPAKAERFNEMQLGPRVGAQADYIAGIGRNFWLKKDNGCQMRLLELQKNGIGRILNQLKSGD